LKPGNSLKFGLSKMSIYLRDIPLPEAQARFQAALEEAGLWRILGADVIPLDEHALGRVTAEATWAKVSSPHYHASAMDGFAVRAWATSGAQSSSPLDLAVVSSPASSGGFTAGEIRPGTAQYLDTGDPLPDWADAVIPIENVEALDEHGRPSPGIRQPHTIRIRSGVAPWAHVRPLGEDIVATQLVLPSGQALRPVDLGAVAASGHHEIRVSRKPRVAILPTGSELVPLGSQLGPGDIIEYNSIVLAAQILSMGGDPRRFPPSSDDFELIRRRVLEAAANADLVLLNAGSSAGSDDLSARIVAALGSLLVHGVAVRPGHPVILGLLRPEREVEGSGALVPIVGVPGYPVSAALTIEIFVEPLLAKWLGRPRARPETVSATITRKVVSPAGDDDYVRVALGKVGEDLLAAPLSRGAGVITSLVHADGLAVLPRGVQGLEAGDRVEVRLYRSRSELEKTIFCIGSHDLTLDLLAQFLAQRERRLVSANVGSQGGLVALSRSRAHIAGSHLLDPETGEYNLTFLQRYLPDIPVRVIALVRREQGLLVQPGNPKRIQGLQDLARPEVLFVNRQRGAGTRVLLDYQLDLMGITSQSIRGYNEEQYTHLGIAAAIASGRADCGLGIAAAAQALGLAFIPLFQERYDLIIPQVEARGELLKPLFEVLVQKDFQDSVAALPGYDVSVMGSVILEV